MENVITIPDKLVEKMVDWENPHNIESIEDDSFDLTRNKLVSNADIKEILDSISGLTFTENISVT